MKKLFALLLAVMMVFSLVACTEEPADTTAATENGNDTTPNADTTAPTVDPESLKYGGHLDACLYFSPKNLDPAKSTGVWQYMWTSMIYEAPLTRDAEGNIRPNVCDFELSDDQLTLKLWVREGVTFHDGSAVEIDDVIASIKRTVHKSPRQFVAAFIKDVAIDDKGVATITFTEYNEKTMYYIACVNPFVGVMPKEIAEKFSEESGEVITNVADAIGTGPYKVSEFESTVKVALVRHDAYVPVEAGYTGFAAPKMAYMDSITFHANTEASTSTLALLGGQYDIFSGISADFDAQLDAAKIVRLPKLSNTAATLQFNTFGESIVNTSADMRKAIVAAIDLPEFINFMSEGKISTVGCCPVMDGIYYTDVFEKADYMGADDVALSKKYQEAAGYKGEEIELVMSSNYDDVATLLSGYLNAAGIKNKITMLESATATERYNDPKGEWSLYYTNPTINNSPTLLAANLMTTNYNSAEKDALYKELQGMLAGTDTYIAKWKELAQQMVDDCPTVYLWQNTLNWAYNPDLNWDYDGVNAYFWNAYWTNPADHTN